ncbi:hypothetical protein [Myxococcus landrumensis]|uniref:Uncharacterized protein n=1 Tax=Myxococcus landrumensis TaxID=2813577 RepID=A0ABX7N327_9BACT|nr:hypothetical protein [Myxococcus landrumus]QSQ13127.1 hypothetical protein JY572_33030 [Myxococcus landrumus]
MVLKTVPLRELSVFASVVDCSTRFMASSAGADFFGATEPVYWLWV